MKRVVMLALLLVVAGCAPVATAVLNEGAGGPADLVFVLSDDTPCGPVGANGLCFVPGDAEVQGASVLIRSRTGDLEAFDEACVPVDVGARCDLGEPREPAFLYAAGSAVQASVTYRLPGSNRVYTEFAVH